MDVPWQKSFQTDDRAEVERICHERGIECDWLAGDVLRTSQACQGTLRHPATGERFFFNQAHLFHVSALGGATAAMLRQFGLDRLPRHAFFGDGGEIPTADLEAVRKAFQAEAIAFPWQAGDVILADNLQVAHGRRPFRGQRKVVVALLEGHTTTPEALRLAGEPATA
jgi:alpha-ketoglutarate-dependent taurine dioxygenase